MKRIKSCGALQNIIMNRLIPEIAADVIIRTQVRTLCLFAKRLTRYALGVTKSRTAEQEKKSVRDAWELMRAKSAQAVILRMLQTSLFFLRKWSIRL
jgi:hypothetical protein